MPKPERDAGSDASLGPRRPLTATIEPPVALDVDAGTSLDFVGHCEGPAPITEQRWDVAGLSATGQGRTFEHVLFADEGQFAVTLHCSDAAGRTASTSVTIRAWHLPSVAFTGLAGPSTLIYGYYSSVDAYATSLTPVSPSQFDEPRVISPARQAPSTLLPTRGLPAYDGTGTQLVMVAAYRNAYMEAVLVTPCRGSASCNQPGLRSRVQPLLSVPLDVHYARWSPDFQTIVVAGEHDLYLVPVSAGNAGDAVHISDRFADPADLSGAPEDKPTSPFVFVANNGALAFRTRAPQTTLPTGLAIVDIASSLASGTADVHDVAGLLPAPGSDTTTNIVSDLVASPDGHFLTIGLGSWLWASKALHYVTSLDVTAWLADHRQRPVLLAPTSPSYSLNGFVSGGPRLWLEAIVQTGAPTNSPSGWVSYRWDGGDPIWLSERFPSLGRVAVCGDRAITDVVSGQSSLQVLQVTDASTLTLQTFDAEQHILDWDGFSSDCRYALYEGEASAVVMVDLQAQTLSYGPAPSRRVQGARLDPSGKYVLLFDRFGPHTLLTRAAKQLQLLLKLTGREVDAVFTEQALYYIENPGYIFSPTSTQLFRLALDGSTTARELDPIGPGVFGLASAPIGDHISYPDGYVNPSAGTLGGVLETDGTLTTQLLAVPDEPGGRVSSVTSIGDGAVLMLGDFAASGESALYATRVDGSVAAQRQSPLGLSVDSFTIAPNQRWLTAWTSQGWSSYLVSALGIDLSLAPDSARGSTLTRGTSVLGIEDAFATLLVVDHTRILMADGTTRDPWGDQPTYVAATSKRHLVVRLNTDPQALDMNAVLVDVDDTTHETPLPMMMPTGRGAWISPDDQWLVYAAGPFETNCRMRALEVASGAITELQTADGGPLLGDGDDPVFTSDGKLAVVPMHRTLVGNDLVCGALYVVKRGNARVERVGGGKTDHVCSFFVAPDGSHIALSNDDGLFLTDSAHLDTALRVGPGAITFASWSPDTRYLVFLERPDDSPAGPVSVVDLQHLERGPTPLPDAQPYSLSFDPSGQRLLARYAHGWERGFGIWTLATPGEPARVAPADWTVESAVWAP